jgi:hypothetical protein
MVPAPGTGSRGILSVLKYCVSLVEKGAGTGLVEKHGISWFGVCSMVFAPHGTHPRVQVRIGREVLPAVPVLLRGHEALVAMDRVPAARGELRIVLGWQDGSSTELSARLRAVESNGCLAHLDVNAVSGDWRPFLAYVGSAITSPTSRAS